MTPQPGDPRRVTPASGAEFRVLDVERFLDALTADHVLPENF